MAFDDCFPRLQSFLCCIDIRNGIIFIGIVNFLASIANIVLSAFSLNTITKTHSNHIGITLIYAIMLMSLGLFELLLACFLLNGICKVNYVCCDSFKNLIILFCQYETAHLFVYLWLKIIGIIVLFISMILAFLVNKWIGTYLIVNLGKNLKIYVKNFLMIIFCSLYFIFFPCDSFLLQAYEKLLQEIHKLLTKHQAFTLLRQSLPLNRKILFEYFQNCFRWTVLRHRETNYCSTIDSSSFLNLGTFLRTIQRIHIQKRL